MVDFNKVDLIVDTQVKTLDLTYHPMKYQGDVSSVCIDAKLFEWMNKENNKGNK